jgi:hypothetical protein
MNRLPCDLSDDVPENHERKEIYALTGMATPILPSEV